MNNIYEGNLTYLVPIQTKDTSLIIKWRNREFVRKMFIKQELITVETHKKWFETMIETGKAKQFIVYTKNEKRPIGSFFLKNIDMINGEAEYGNFIGEEEYLGKGYGTDAGKVLVKYAMTVLNLDRVYLRVLKKNKRAINAYKKIGFQMMDTHELQSEEIVFMMIQRDKK